MFGLPWWGTGISAVILGGGMAWYLFKKLQQGERDKVRADNLDSYNKADAAANRTEAAMKKVRDDAFNSDHADTDI